MNMLKRLLFPVLLLLLSAIAILPLFSQGFFPIHDDTQIARVFEMNKSLHDGLFPVRFVADLGYGYGYPIFSFYAPLAYYVGALFMSLGLTAMTATKTMIGLGVLLAGMTMYFLARQFMGEKSAVVAGLLYVYAPYHAVNFFVRGAVGELWAYAFIPLAFLGIWKLAQKPSWRHVGLCAIGFAGVIVSHNLTALIVTPFLLAGAGMLMLTSRQHSGKRQAVFLVLGIGLALLVSSWYWLPAIGEMQYTNVVSQAGGGSAYADHFVCINQLWSSPWGFGGSTSGCLDGLSFQIGKLHILLGLIGLVVGLGLQKLRKQRFVVLFTAFCLLFSVLMTLEMSKPVWDGLPFMKYVQFPWRYLSLVVFFLSLLGGLALSGWENIFKGNRASLVRLGGVVAVIVFLLLLSSKNFHPKFLYDTYRDETDPKIIVWTISRISDEYLPKAFKKPDTEVAAATQRIGRETTVNAQVISDKTGEKVIQLESERGGKLALNLAYFPAWQFLLDSQPLTASVSDGMYYFILPKGSHTLQARFMQTPLEKAANTVSVISVVVLILGIILERKRRKA